MLIEVIGPLPEETSAAGGGGDFSRFKVIPQQTTAISP